MTTIAELKNQTRTPTQRSADYDWRKEAWVADEKIRSLSHYIAMHVLSALAADGYDKAEEQDNIVLCLLSPETTEHIWKSPAGYEIIDARISCAAAMGIDKLISKWLERFGDIDHNGPPDRREAKP